MSKLGRNEPCPCGSGKKYKRCCLDKGMVQSKAGKESGPGSQDIKQINKAIASGIPKDSLTNLLKLIDEGYVDFRRERYSSSLDKWLKAWNLYKVYLPRIVTWDEEIVYDMTSEVSLEGHLLNWLQDMAMIVQDSAHESKDADRRFIQFTRELFEAYPRCDASTKERMKRDVAEAYFYLGMPEEGEKHFTDLVKAFPFFAWAWIGWADMYSVFRNRESVPFDYERAKGYYLKALEVDESVKSVVEERLENLEEMRKKDQKD